MNEALIAAGFVVGLLVGVTGVGGGAIMTPLLVLLFGVPARVAIGTDLLFAAVTKLFGVAVHGYAGVVDRQVLIRLLVGSVPAAIATGLILSVVGRASVPDELDQFLLNALAWLLLLSALGVFMRPLLHRVGRGLRLAKPERFKRLQAPLTVLMGALIGVAVSLTSVGAGALGAVAMLYLYPLRLQGARLVGTDLAHAIPLALVAGSAHWIAGGVDWHLLGTLLVGSVPGIIVGAYALRWVSAQWVNYGVAILLFISGAKLLFG